MFWVTLLLKLSDRKADWNTHLASAIKSFILYTFPGRFCGSFLKCPHNALATATLIMKGMMQSRDRDREILIITRLYCSGQCVLLDEYMNCVILQKTGNSIFFSFSAKNDAHIGRCDVTYPAIVIPNELIFESYFL